jgi:hypothetical protein
MKQRWFLVLILVVVGWLGMAAGGDCRQDCLDDFGEDLDECMVLPPDEQGECMEQAAQTLVNCLHHCPNTTKTTSTTTTTTATNITTLEQFANPKLAALNIYFRAFADANLNLSTFWNEMTNKDLCRGDFDGCRLTEEWLAWIHIPRQHHKIVIAGYGSASTRRRVCLETTHAMAWIPNGTCSGSVNFLCDHRCYGDVNICTRGKTTATKGPPANAFCTDVDDTTLFHLLSLILPSFTIILV